MKKIHTAFALVLPFALAALGGCSNKESARYELKEIKQEEKTIAFYQITAYTAISLLQNPFALTYDYIEPSLLADPSAHLSKSQARAAAKAAGVPMGENSQKVEQMGHDYDVFAPQSPSRVTNSINLDLAAMKAEGSSVAFFLTASFKEAILADKDTGKEFSIYYKSQGSYLGYQVR
jgi:hypothetical protein